VAIRPVVMAGRQSTEAWICSLQPKKIGETHGDMG